MTAPYDSHKLKPRWDRDHYTKMLLGLLPPGVIWRGRQWSVGRIIQDIIPGAAGWQDTTDSATVIQDGAGDASTGDILARIFYCLAGELERLEKEAWKILNQTDPGVADDLLVDWEEQLELPDSCYADIDLSPEERQTQAHEKASNTGQTTTHDWYVAYALALGYTITIVENPVDTSPSVCGGAICGEARCGGQGGYSNMTITITAADGDIDILKCFLNKEKQAHVIISWVDAT